MFSIKLKTSIILIINKSYVINIKWGLGIGDWAQYPIPNPQSPINKFNLN